MKRDFSRQSFLPSTSETTLASVKVGVVGLCGGGSHAIQQLSHIGVLNYVVADGDRIDNSNLNRLVGGTLDDVVRKQFKTHIAERMIKNINPSANVRIISRRWQDDQSLLRDCSVIFGCVDSYAEREQLERFCRRFLIHYIDVGMDVLKFDENHRIVGQVFMSSPGWCCLRCAGIITEKNLELEVQRYGKAGAKPQVVWPNGILASTAIGLFMQLVCPWHNHSSGFAYLEYSGNTSTISESPRAKFAILIDCEHYSTKELGDPFFDIRELMAA